mgnify:CR=1 FL=1
MLRTARSGLFTVAVLGASGNAFYCICSCIELASRYVGSGSFPGLCQVFFCTGSALRVQTMVGMCEFVCESQTRNGQLLAMLSAVKNRRPVPLRDGHPVELVPFLFT